MNASRNWWQPAATDFADVDELTHAVSLFERSPRSLALAAAWEDRGVTQQRDRARARRTAYDWLVAERR